MMTFFGTSPRSAKFLKLAAGNGLKFDLVVSEPPKPIGKKQTLTENPTVLAAKELNISCLTSISQLQDPTSNFYRPSSNLTIGLILDFNKIIPTQTINLFKMGIINVHFSKLPLFRGPAPVQYTILNGDKEAWITYYLISEKLDAGLILAQTSLALDLTENTETLYQKLIEKSAGEVKNIIQDYLEGKITPQPQSGIPSTTHKLTTENCRIDWTKSPVEIERLIRAAYPEPGAWVSVPINSQSAKIPSEKRLKILKAHLENNKLVLDQVQLEGKKPVTFKQFQQGYPNISTNITWRNHVFL